MGNHSDIKRERETVIAWNESLEDAVISTGSPIFQRRLHALGLFPRRTTAHAHGISWQEYDVPKDWVTVRKPRVGVFSEARRAHLQQLARARFAKASKEKFAALDAAEGATTGYTESDET